LGCQSQRPKWLETDEADAGEVQQSAKTLEKKPWEGRSAGVNGGPHKAEHERPNARGKLANECRLLEALRLRVKDVGFSRREIVVRDGKGHKDRMTVLP